MSSSFAPPADLWEVNRKLQLDEPLDGPMDPRWVDTEEARGEYNLRSLYRALGVEGTGSQSARRLRKPPERGYYLFCGHRGCGKSTELRRIREDLHEPNVYYVAFADAARDLDPSNLRYQDVLLHLAATLTRQLEDDAVRLASAPRRRPLARRHARPNRRNTGGTRATRRGAPYLDGRGIAGLRGTR